jgi:TolB-like protein/DNA-binding winged helix-turn-helix (wHTH) protein/Tfp pilus assembly protein PilF
MSRQTDVREASGSERAAPAKLRFGGFELDAEAAELNRGGVPVRLQQQPCRVLALLASRAGELVTRDEIQRSVWGADTYVNFDQGLNFCIKEIRAALRDQADTPRFIETLPRRGYRFIAEVDSAPDPGGSAGAESPPEALGTRGPSRGPWFALLALAVGVAGAFAVSRAAPRSRDRASPPPGRRLMLAVLPFENLSADPRQEYLSDGLTEEMIAQIGRLQPERLGVIARTSAMQYRSRNKDVEQIGDELGVDFIVEGSVRRGQDRVRITVKLIQVSDQTQLWAEAYDRDPGDLLAVQREVAEAVARSIQLTLSAGAQALLERSAGVEGQAYELFLRGRHAWNRRDHAGLERSVEFFERAIEIDPDFALAHVGLADAWIVLGDRYRPPSEARPRIRAAAARALALDPELAEAQASMAMLEGGFEWQWEAALARFRHALDLNPNSATSRHWYSQMLSAVGQPEAALAEAELALELDPLSLIIHTTAGTALYGAGRYSDAIARFQRTIEMDPEWTPGHYGLGRSLLRLGEDEAGLAALRRAAESPRFRRLALAHLAAGHAALGDPARAREVLLELEAAARTDEEAVALYELAVARAAAGEPERALEALERAAELGVPRLRFLRNDDRLASLRDAPRFARLLERVGLADESD